jgi:hypothetical protein
MSARSERLGWMLGGVIVVGAGVAGCWPFDYASDPVLIGQVCEDGTLDCFGTGTGGAGGTTTVTPGCIPSENDSGLDDTCGVFVSASLGQDVDEEGRGSKGKPWATIAAALGAATGKPVYLCGETFAETVEIKAGARVYGALDCTAAEWPYAAAKRTVIAPTVEGMALRVTSKAKLELYDVNVTSADATTAGASSIAVFAEVDTDVMLTRCDVEAKSGAEGESPAPEGTGTPGPIGENGAAGCINNQSVAGGNGGANVCEPGAVKVSGGSGGTGTIGDGSDGSAGKNGAMPGGALGTGQVDGAPVVPCTDGGEGAAGVAGDPGAGATDAELGTLDASGFGGVAGSDGMTSGTPGAGAGGGGGAKGCANLISAGPSGGGGGAGGCGGAPGKGGMGGGASIGLVSLGAKLTFATVTITAGAGGKGGAGGVGQPGGAGGDGGSPGAGDGTAIACSGGKGGAGGPGGRGGGGRGGPSIGVAHTGTAPSLKDVTITPGKAGEGGEGDGAAGQGKPGVSKPVQAF